jgi:hypothetical protein
MLVLKIKVMQSQAKEYCYMPEPREDNKWILTGAFDGSLQTLSLGSVKLILDY